MKQIVTDAIAGNRSFMMAVAYSIVRNRDAAEDIVQDALFNAITRQPYEPVGPLHLERNRFLTWLGAVVRRAAGDYLKSPTKGLNRMVPMSQLADPVDEPFEEFVLDLSAMDARQSAALGELIDRKPKNRRKAKKGASLAASVGITVGKKR